MRYWIYLNNEIKGPFTKEELPGVPGYTQDTLICPETPPEGKTQEWQPATVVLAAADAQPVPAPTPAPEPTPEPAPQAERPALVQEHFPTRESQQGEQFQPQAETQPSIQPVANLDLPQSAAQTGQNIQLAMENSADILSPLQAAQPAANDVSPMTISRIERSFQTQSQAGEQPLQFPAAQDTQPVAMPDFAPQQQPYAAAAPVNPELTAKLDRLDQSINNIGQMLETTQRQMSAPQPAQGTPDAAEAAKRMEQMMSEISELKTEMNILLSDMKQSHSDIAAKLSELGNTVATLSSQQQMQQNNQAPAAATMMMSQGYGNAVLPSSPAQQSSAQMSMGGQQNSESPAKSSEVNITMENAPAKKGGFFKMLIKVFGIIVVLVGIAAVLFVVLLKQGMLPPSLNPFKKATPVAVQIPGAAKPSSAGTAGDAAAPANQSAQGNNQQLLAFVRSYELRPGLTLETAINESVPQILISSIDWQVTMLQPTQYSISVRVPPSGPSGWPVSYHFDYDTDKKTVTPVNAEAQNLVTTAQRNAPTNAGQKNDAAAADSAKAKATPVKKPRKKQITSKLPAAKTVDQKKQDASPDEEVVEEIVEE